MRFQLPWQNKLTFCPTAQKRSQQQPNTETTRLKAEQYATVRHFEIWENTSNL